MNGAESLVHTLLLGGVDTCFANPGTSEMHFVAALDRIPGMRCVLALFEGVATGAADGYQRMAGKPAATLLHCGPGLANGIANLHNARRARAGIVNIVGDQATYHDPLDPPLASEIESFARPVSAAVLRAARPHLVGGDAARAVAVARGPGGGIATLVLPSDASWDEGGIVAAPLPFEAPYRVADDAVADAATVLRSGKPALILLGGRGTLAEPIASAHAIAAATGAKLIGEGFGARIERGRGRHPLDRVPYVVEMAVEMFRDIREVILVGADEPVTFFAYPGKPGLPFAPGTRLRVLARPDEDAADALARLADAVGARPVPPPDHGPAVSPARGAMTPDAIARTLTALLPEDSIVVDESISAGFPFYSGTERAARHTWLRHVGGAIGIGLPLATGAAIGAPGRRVVTLQGDGSALYTVQALWTQAREKLDVTTVIFANRGYAILRMEMAGVGANPGRTALNMLDVTEPDVDWVKIAEGFGVEAARAETMETFADLLELANRRSGPFLIELVLP
ncbi:MAG: acetolactate synthase large subunit [Rhizobiales bacterium]|nr:acetolactate synthase large subunit [Hyphomicrobiales bacterium]